MTRRTRAISSVPFGSSRSQTPTTDTAPVRNLEHQVMASRHCTWPSPPPSQLCARRASAAPEWKSHTATRSAACSAALPLATRRRHAVVEQRPKQVHPDIELTRETQAHLSVRRPSCVDINCMFQTQLRPNRCTQRSLSATESVLGESMRPAPPLHRQRDGLVHARQELSDIQVATLATARNPRPLVGLQQAPFVYGEHVRIERLEKECHARRNHKLAKHQQLYKPARQFHTNVFSLHRVRVRSVYRPHGKQQLRPPVEVRVL